MLTAARRLGNLGEDAAAALLRDAGLRILARNWRAGRLELDLVCADGDTLVFVEVRTRSAGSMVHPLETLTSRKRLALLRAARAWQEAHEAWDQPCRFDLVCVTREGARLIPEHYPHVFDFSELVDRRHTAWQPW